MLINMREHQQAPKSGPAFHCCTFHSPAIPFDCFWVGWELKNSIKSLYLIGDPGWITILGQGKDLVCPTALKALSARKRQFPELSNLFAAITHKTMAANYSRTQRNLREESPPHEQPTFQQRHRPTDTPKS